MTHYYDFLGSEKCIEYKPYLYDEEENKIYIYIGFSFLFIAFLMFHFSIFREYLVYALIMGISLILNGLYRIFIEQQTVINMNLSTNEIRRQNPIRTQTIRIDDIYDLFIKEENNSYIYCVNLISNPSNTMKISSYIDNKRKKRPEVLYLENELIHTIYEFLELDKKAIYGQQNYMNRP